MPNISKKLIARLKRHNIAWEVTFDESRDAYVICYQNIPTYKYGLSCAVKKEIVDKDKGAVNILAWRMSYMVLEHPRWSKQLKPDDETIIRPKEFPIA